MQLIHQYFTPPEFSHVQYIVIDVIDGILYDCDDDHIICCVL